eukprot:SAG31_NODE_2766_length_5123_cov_3.395900_3_plen_233_part_00
MIPLLLNGLVDRGLGTLSQLSCWLPTAVSEHVDRHHRLEDQPPLAVAAEKYGGKQASEQKKKSSPALSPQLYGSGSSLASSPTHLGRTSSVGTGSSAHSYVSSDYALFEAIRSAVAAAETVLCAESIGSAGMGARSTAHLLGAWKQTSTSNTFFQQGSRSATLLVDWQGLRFSLLATSPASERSGQSLWPRAAINVVTMMTSRSTHRVCQVTTILASCFPTPTLFRIFCFFR